jgi:hypothetical protein
MTYAENGDKVTLEMTRGDYGELIMLLGYKLGAVLGAPHGQTEFWGFLDFVNRLNATNPHFTQYQIPEEFRK